MIEEILTWRSLFESALKDLKTKFPNFSEAQIAEKIQIPRATLNRYYNESSKPSLDNYLKVIIHSGNETSIEKAMELYDNVFKVSLKENNKKFVTPELDQLFEDRDLFVTYLLASHELGITENQLFDVLGSCAKTSLATLLQKNLLVEKENTFYVNEGAKSLIRSFESIKYHLNTYTRFYKTDHVGHKRNYVHSLTEGLNQNGVEALQAAHRTFHESVQNIMRESSHKGDIPMFTVAFCDSFTSLNQKN